MSIESVNDCIYGLIDDIHKKDEEIVKLDQELALYKKALELACYDMGDIQEARDYYLQKAKEEIENETKSVEKIIKR